MNKEKNEECHAWGQTDTHVNIELEFCEQNSQLWIYSVHHYSGNPTVSLMTIASKNPSRIRILMRLVKSIQNLMDFFLVSPSSHEPPPLPRFGKYIYGEKSAMKF